MPTTSTRPAETTAEKARRLTARYFAAFDIEKAAWEGRDAATTRDYALLPESVADERDARRRARLNVLIKRTAACEMALARFLVRQAGTPALPDFRVLSESQIPPAAVAAVAGVTLFVLWVDGPKGLGLSIRHTRSAVVSY